MLADELTEDLCFVVRSMAGDENFVGVQPGRPNERRTSSLAAKVASGATAGHYRCG